MLTSMELILGADHRGFDLKEQLKAWLVENKYAVTDVGAAEKLQEDDYPKYGLEVGQKVAEKPTERLGIVVCGSGAGITVAAGKVPGVRAVLMHNPVMASHARQDDDVNVLGLGADYISFDEAKEVVHAWLTAKFSDAERHVRRLEEISKYEGNRK